MAIICLILRTEFGSFIGACSYVKVVEDRPVLYSTKMYSKNTFSKNNV